MKAFDNEKYLRLQAEKIQERIDKYDNKLYLEFGGKIFDDYHASRVLPGFEIDSKVKMLFGMKERVEVIIAISAQDIQSGKMRSDIGISYENETIRMIQAFNEMELYVGGVVITKYNKEISADKFRRKLKNMGITTYIHYPILGYPTNADKIVSEEGYGKNDYIKTTHPLVVVTAPGPGSGKMATCLSQLYHDNKNGKKSGYAKYETFPIWNLPLKHPTNLAYEAATADLNDVNMIDPFHYSAYNTVTVNYNRDIEIFPVLETLFKKIYGDSPYKSPTDMGVNMAGFCINDEEEVRKACESEVIRRYYDSICDAKSGKVTDDVVEKISLIMSQLGIDPDQRGCVKAARDKATKTGVPVIAFELADGMIITGKTSSLLNATAAALLNSVKYLDGLRDQLNLISPNVIEPIQDLKVKLLGNRNPRLHANDVLIALAIAATTNPIAEEALQQLPRLEGAQAHSTVILPYDDEATLKKLKINLTYDPVVFAKRLYRKE